MRVRLVYATGLLLWLGLSLLIALSFAGRAMNSAGEHFKAHAQRVSEQVGQRLQANEAVLDSYASFTGLAVSRMASDERRFVQHLLNRYPQILGLMRVERVPRAQRPVWLAGMRQQYGADFRLRGLVEHPAGEVDDLGNKLDYFPVVRTWPPGRTGHDLLGVDIGYNDFLRDPLQQAIDTGRSAISRPFLLGGNVPAYLMIRPVGEVDNRVTLPLSYVAMLVRADNLPGTLSDMPAGMTLNLHHRDYPLGERRGWFLDHPGETRSLLETLLFPSFEVLRQVGGEGQPVILQASLQTGWRDFGMFDRAVACFISLSLLGVMLLGLQGYRKLQAARRAREVRLFHLANHDRLTGLANRNLFYDRLQHAMTRVNRSGRRLAVLFLDMDRFKPVNDTFGHAAGDRVLQVIATRLTAVLRGEDTVARLGGDEFVVLLEDVVSGQEVDIVLTRLKEAIEKPYDVGGQPVWLGVSIGVAYYPEDGLLIEELVSAADRNMYGDKADADPVF